MNVFELEEYLNENYDDGRNVKGWEISTASFEDLARENGLKITSKNKISYLGAEKDMWQWVDFVIHNKEFSTRTRR